MSDQAQRVLDALMEFDSEKDLGFPILTITNFFSQYEYSDDLEKDYQTLTVDEEKQVIKAFLEFAY